MGVNLPNEAGKHDFYAVLEDRLTADYRMHADGKLSLPSRAAQAWQRGVL
jgi:hypothetical protein